MRSAIDLKRRAGRPRPFARQESVIPTAALERPTRLSLGDAALFLDLDGTLAEFESRPQDVRPDARRTALVQRACERLGRRVAVVSGRSLEEIDKLVPAIQLCAAGSHGLERRTGDASLDLAAPHPALEEAAQSFQSLADARPGLLVERKPLSVALHYRNAAGAGDAVLDLAERVSAATGLALQGGRMVVELKTPGRDKGDAVRAFMAEAPFTGASPIFVGDDLTDEAGFRAAQAFGGYGVLVGDRRNTVAQARLADVPAVLDWLERSLDAGAFELEARQ